MNQTIEKSQTLAEVGPVPAQWYSITDRPNGTSRMLARVSNPPNKVCLSCGRFVATNHLFDPRLLSLQEAKQHLGDELKEAASSVSNEKNAHRKAHAVKVFEDMKKFNRKHFS